MLVIVKKRARKLKMDYNTIIDTNLEPLKIIQKGKTVDTSIQDWRDMIQVEEYKMYTCVIDMHKT